MKSRDLEPKLITVLKEGYTTNITFTICAKEAPCIIHLDRLPLFYHPRFLTRIATDKNNISQIRISSISTSQALW
jgi:hypothetical protein